MKKIIITAVATILAATTLALIPNFVSNEKVNNTSNVEDNIYATISFGSGDAVIDMESVNALYDFADLVVVGNVTQKDDATMSEFSPFPYTPYKMTAEKVIKGDIAEREIQFNVSGGAVTIKTFIENTKSTWERAEKIGLTKLSEKEQESKYIQYISNHTDEYAVGESYIMILKKCADGTYTVIDDNGTIEIGDYEILDSINSKKDVIQIADIVKNGEDLSAYVSVTE